MENECKHEQINLAVNVQDIRMKKLTTKQKEVLYMKEVEGMSITEIANAMNVTYNAIMQRWKKVQYIRLCYQAQMCYAGGMKIDEIDEKYAAEESLIEAYVKRLELKDTSNRTSN